MHASTELRLMITPTHEYARLAAATEPGSTWRALSRPALTLLIVGFACAAGTTGRVDAAVVASGALCWSFAVAIQIVVALVLIKSVRHRHVDVRRALELLFLGHAPWSLWLLAAATAAMLVPRFVSLNLLLVSALVPTAWTAVMLLAFCRQVLGDDRRRALQRTVGHQSLTWTFIVAYLAVTTQVWPRILGRIAP